MESQGEATALTRCGILTLSHGRSRQANYRLRSEVRQHTSRKSCWIIVNNDVYDVTNFIDSHPGGPRFILNYGGRDATKAFEELHSAGTLEKYLTPQ